MGLYGWRKDVWPYKRLKTTAGEHGSNANFDLLL